MTEHLPPTRDQAAAQLDREAPRDINLRRARTPGDLVRAAVSADAYSRPLDSTVRSNDAIDTALRWRFLTQVEGEPYTLRTVEFGLTQEDTPSPLSHLESEIRFDQDIEDHASTIPPDLFIFAGGPLMERTYGYNRPFFAGLERRLRRVETSDGVQYTEWTQLIYPRELRSTLDIVRSKHALLAKDGQDVRWAERMIKRHGKNPSRAADAMALCALLTMKRRHATEHADGC